jgi:hypothetical protein
MIALTPIFPAASRGDLPVLELPYLRLRGETLAFQARRIESWNSTESLQISN